MSTTHSATGNDNQPIATRRFDRVHAAIWRRVESDERGERSVYSITFSRNYKNAANEWQRTHSLTPRDLPHLRLAVDWALRELMLKDE